MTIAKALAAVILFCVMAVSMTALVVAWLGGIPCLFVGGWLAREAWREDLEYWQRLKDDAE